MVLLVEGALADCSDRLLASLFLAVDLLRLFVVVSVLLRLLLIVDALSVWAQHHPLGLVHYQVVL